MAFSAEAGDDGMSSPVKIAMDNKQLETQEKSYFLFGVR